MLLAVLSSKAYYGNNKTFCGLMLFLAGCYTPEGPNFLSWQLALTYFGAGLNKVLDLDWHSGVFFENWAVNRLHQGWYIAADSVLPPMWLARFMCWSTIVTELGTVPLVLVPRLFFWGGLANIFFQSCLLLFIGNTFTLFFYSMCGATFALVTWPQSPLLVVYQGDCASAKRLRRVLHWWDFDGRFQWRPLEALADSSLGIAGDNEAKGIQLIAGSRSHMGFRAIRLIVLYNPVTHFVIAGAIAAAGEVQSEWASIYRRVIVFTCLVILMPPLAWVLDALRSKSTFCAACIRADQIVLVH